MTMRIMTKNVSCFDCSHTDKYKELEDEHDRLSESVVTLSTQFAHIQFRLQQIAVAPEDGRNVSFVFLSSQTYAYKINF